MMNHYGVGSTLGDRLLVFAFVYLGPAWRTLHLLALLLLLCLLLHLDRLGFIAQWRYDKDNAAARRSAQAKHTILSESRLMQSIWELIYLPDGHKLGGGGRCRCKDERLSFSSESELENQS